MIRTKCIKARREASDGVRISVMSSHTLNDGMTPDDSIQSYMYDIHLPELSAPRKLLGDYYKRGISWEEYEIRYLEHIRQPEINDLLKELMVKHNTITFLCIEESDEYCHRRLLKEECDLINNEVFHA